MLFHSGGKAAQWSHNPRDSASLARGCGSGARAAPGWTMKIGDATFDRCPLCWLEDETWLTKWLPDIFRAQSGLLPKAGGVDDQPAEFVQCWSLFDVAWNETTISHKRREAARAEAKAKLAAKTKKRRPKRRR